MDRIDLDLGDVFGDREESSAELQMPTDHPDMDGQNEAPMAAEGEDNADDQVAENIRNLVKGAAKKKVMKPQPKLDAQRLKSDKGLPALAKTFEGVKFKGRGHEASDLKQLMNKLEHWGHRLFPKMTFDEVIQRLEKLGVKREVKTCLTRIRLDMPITDDDYVGEANIAPNSDEENNDIDNNDTPLDPTDAFDEMIRQEREEATRRNRQDDEDEYDYFDGAPSVQTPSSPVQASSHSQPSAPHTPKTPSTPTGMSEEMKERAERNRLAALEKRAKRMGVPVSALMPSQPSQSSQVSEEKREEKNKDDQEEEDMLTEDALLGSLELDEIPTEMDNTNPPVLLEQSPSPQPSQDKVEKSKEKEEEEEMLTEDAILDSLELDTIETISDNENVLLPVENS